MAKDVSAITLGVGELTIDGNDVGYLGGTVTYSTDVEVQAFSIGIPKHTMGRVVTSFEATLKASLAQLDMLSLALGVGVGNYVSSRFCLGTSWELPILRNVKFVHTRDDGKEITIFMPKAQIVPGGEIVFSPTDFTIQNITITAIYDDSSPSWPVGVYRDLGGFMSKNSESLTLGIGDLYVDGKDVGYLAGDVTVTTETEAVEFRHGTHQALVKRVITTLNRSITASLAQIDIDTLYLALGIGEKSTVNGGERINFGTNWNLPILRNVKFVHTRDDGKKITVFMPQAQINPGSSELTFSSGEFLSQSITLTAVEDINRTDCPMGFIQVGDSDDTAQGGGGFVPPDSSQEGNIQNVTDEVVNAEAEESWYNYRLAHNNICDQPAPIVKSEDGNTTYSADTDYDINFSDGVITTNGKTESALADGAIIKVTYSYNS